MGASDFASFFYGQNNPLSYAQIQQASQDIADGLQNGGKKGAKKSKAVKKPDSKPKPRGFAAKTLPELQKLAKERNIKGRSAMNKQQLIDALRK